MENNISKLFAFILGILLTSGCEDSGSASSQPQHVAPIAATLGYATLQPGQKQYISLSDWVVSTNGNAKVVDLLVAQGDDVCGAPDISGLGFYIESYQEGSCRIDYVVESLPGTNQTPQQASSSVGLISSDEQRTELPPISIALHNHQQVIIDLHTKLAEDYPVDYVLSPAITLLGAGSASADPVSSDILFQAASEGVSRILYSLEGIDPASPETKVGFVDVSVSVEASEPPIALPFVHPVHPQVNQTIEIDVLGYVSDPDDDPLQLVDVQSYYADVASAVSNDSLNTKLNFSAALPGRHYVSYTVSDNRGGYSSNFIEVRVQDPSQDSQWADIQLGLNVYSGPLTEQEAASQFVATSGHLVDEGYTPAISMATFSAEEAVDYCADIGRLPTSKELSDLVSHKAPATSLNWPHQSQYLAEDEGHFNRVDLSTGNSTPYTEGYQYVTCVSDGELVINQVNSQAIADGIDQVIVDVTVMLNGIPTSGEYVDASITGSAVLGSSTVVTNGSGVARFTATSSVAERVDITFSYQGKDDVTVRGEFMGDSEGSYLSSLTLVTDRASADGVDVNQLTAQVLDRNGNPVKGVEVEVLIWEETDDGSASGPASLTTNELGEVYIEVSNSDQEYVDVRAYYTSPSTPPEISYYDQRTQFYHYNTLKPVNSGGLLWTAPLTEQEALAIEASDPNIDFGPDTTQLEDGTYGPTGMIVSSYNWVHADDFCYFLDYAGYRDWRLPTENELVTFYQSSQPDYPDKGVFGQYGWPTYHAFWSSSDGDTGSHSAVRLYDGHVELLLGSNTRYVSCVR